MFYKGCLQERKQYFFYLKHKRIVQINATFFLNLYLSKEFVDRKNPYKFEVTKPKVHKKGRFGTMFTAGGGKSDSGSEVLDLGSRVISFGKLPSYR